jgi:hypothetical protein
VRTLAATMASMTAITFALFAYALVTDAVPPVAPATQAVSR